MDLQLTIRTSLAQSRRLLIPIGVLLGVWATAASAAADTPADVIVLPGASSAEGIAVGRGSTFYAGDLLRGDIFRGDLQRGTAELFIDAPSGRWAVGMEVDPRGDLLFVAGGATGQGYVYDTTTGATEATYQFADPSAVPGAGHRGAPRQPTGGGQRDVRHRLPAHGHAV